MPEIMVVLNDAEDRALHAGRVVSLPTYGAPFLHVTLAGKRIKLGDVETNGGARRGPVPGPATLTRQRGDCPYCEQKGLLLAGHIRNRHPGKVIPWLGPNPVPCPKCPATFPSRASLAIHTHMVHKTAKKPAKKSGGKSA